MLNSNWVCTTVMAVESVAPLGAMQRLLTLLAPWSRGACHATRAPPLVMMQQQIQPGEPGYSASAQSSGWVDWLAESDRGRALRHPYGYR